MLAPWIVFAKIILCSFLVNMSYVDTLNQVQPELRSLYREFEKNCKSIIREDWAIKFNESCLREDMLPTFKN